MFSTVHAHRSLIAEQPNYFGRPKQPKRRLLQVAKTCYTGSSEQDIAKDGKQDISPSPDERSKHSHEECTLQMNTPGLRPWSVAPPRTSFFILDSRATSHLVRDVSLFSPSFSTGGCSPSPGSAPYPATTSVSPTRGVSQTSVPDSTWSPCSS